MIMMMRRRRRRRRQGFQAGRQFLQWWYALPSTLDDDGAITAQQGFTDYYQLPIA